VNFRSKLAVRAAKLTSILIKKMNRGSGVTLPGYVARLIDPKILSHLSSMISEKVIVVMGTNGKTTVNAILCQTLEAEGYKVISNRTGANMQNGIVSAFVLATDKSCALTAHYACIEVDEITSVGVLPLLTPNFVVLTNIARDQIDRFGEMETTIQKIKTAFESTPKTTLVINCDDVFSYSLARECGNSFITYGINENIFKNDSFKENLFCRFCSFNQKVSPLGEDSGKEDGTSTAIPSDLLEKPTPLHYEFYHYGQLGIYSCPLCDFKRPTPDYTATNIVRTHDTYSFEIDGLEINSTATATYNIYNTLSAVTVLKVADAKVPHLKESLERFDYGNNRESTFMIGDSKVQLHLAKNPIGFGQKIALMIKDDKPKDILFIINDTYQDGEDVSWLWDVDFTLLSEAKFEKLLCGGIRKYDVGLRLKYEEIPCEFVDNLETTLEPLIANGTKNIYLIVNYSALVPTNTLLKKFTNDGQQNLQ